ncbi:DUF6651 domain-containing protein [Methylobacterium hispanicum]|uniref:DUF6651 domain-containing protein n=1 Tax=Methylobacterium hispanicum TaxID=270350 RepID=UPI002F31EE9D
MKLKLDEAGHVVVADGKPVYVHEDGKEAPFDAVHTLATITRLNGEAKGHRERAEKAEGSLKAFEGIEDVDAARKALETVKNLSAGDLVKSEKVEEIKAAAKKAAEEQVAAAAKASNEQIKVLTESRDGLQRELYGEKVGGSFTRSKYVSEKIAIPPDMLQARFGDRFKVENGRVVGYGQDGQPIYSRTRAGEIADFDEALESMVDAYPYRDSILKGTGSSGSGARPSNGGGGGDKKTMTQAAFDALPPMQQAKLMSGADRPAIVG